ncbi:hypothetical protein ABW20_dc0105414 [Dactylellina cionopaga]|nr:hypothetical protein ABW20_dc0105414 [Dactylellina cionopaga]
MLYIIAGVLCALVSLDLYFRRGYNEKEPTMIPPSIPIVGHLIGFLKHGAGYVSRLGYDIACFRVYHISINHPEEIFTINFFNFRLYVINSRHLISPLQRNKNLAFHPFQKKFQEMLAKPSQHMLDLFDTEHMNDLTRVQLASFTPGKGLDDQIGRAAETLMVDFENLTWTKDLTRQISGFPSFLMKTPLKARDTFIEAFKEYFQNDHSNAGEVIHAREKLFTRDHLSLDDICKSQAIFTVGLVGNTSPTVFWTVWDIFSRPQFLADIREELERVAITKYGSENGQLPMFELDISALKTRCPLLLSALEETQRTRMVHANIRRVMEDTLLDGRYWLKKGSFLQIPNVSIHRHPEVWGANAKEYDPTRFIGDGTSIKRSALPTSYAFLAWGAAPTLCPARQFASTQMLFFAAMMVLRFEIEPTYGSGEWKVPDMATGALAVIWPPKGDMQVRVRGRKGAEGLWKLKMGESKARVPLSSG